MADAAVNRAVAEFATALVRWRDQRGLTKKQLAATMGFDPSYVSHVEARRHRPTEDFARRADQALEAAGELVSLYRAFEKARATVPGPRTRSEPPALPWPGTSGALVVEREHAELTYVDGTYRCSVRRHLHNAGREAVTRYPVRIAVDRYPGEPEKSNRHYRDHPLTLAELDLHAHCGDEPMRWQAKQDRDTFKEVWLLFENDDARFPLYPGERATIEYRYGVGEDKWGHWFQRAVRLPTRRLSVHIDLPAALRPVVWGTESSLTTEAAALRTPIQEVLEGDRVRFEWQTEDPALGARYRFEWRLRADVPTQRSSRPAARRPSELMRGAGILQRGAPMLERVARWFDLPEQSSLASEVVSRLLDAVGRVRELHEFHNGLGLAAPQIGIDWAAAVVCPPGDADAAPPLILLNPRIVGESVDHDQQFEGCLSFFDVRGVVSRPLLVEVEHETYDGDRTVSTFRDALARLVTHEVDHLHGLLYADRMPAEGRLVPVEEYREARQPWNYDHARGD
jgi:peptide deformylase